MASRDAVIERMKARTAMRPLNLLADALVTLDRKPHLDDAERLTRTVLMDVICERCPAADAAFGAWAESDDMDQHTAVRVIADAAWSAR